MPPKRIKALIFDLGGVVMHGGYLDFIHHYLGRHLSKQTKQKIEHLERQVNLGKITEQQFYRQIQKEFRVHLTPQQMHQKIIHGMTTNRALVAYIRSIRKTKVALFSNSIGHMATEMLKRRHLNKKVLFDRVFMSEVMHLAKPSRNAYTYVTQHLHVKPHEALMIDDRKLNIDRAKKAGLQGIVFRNTKQFKKDLQRYELI